MTTTTTTTRSCPTAIQGVVGSSSRNGCSFFSFGSTLFVVTMSLKGRICWRQSLLAKLATRVLKSFVFTAQIAPIGGTIIQVKSTCNYNYTSCVNGFLLLLRLKVGPNHNDSHSSSCV
jgi:hypothetical protein